MAGKGCLSNGHLAGSVQVRGGWGDRGAAGRAEEGGESELGLTPHRARAPRAQRAIWPSAGKIELDEVRPCPQGLTR